MNMDEFGLMVPGFTAFWSLRSNYQGELGCKKHDVMYYDAKIQNHRSKFKMGFIPP